MNGDEIRLRDGCYIGTTALYPHVTEHGTAWRQSVALYDPAAGTRQVGVFGGGNSKGVARLVDQHIDKLIAAHGGLAVEADGIW